MRRLFYFYKGGIFMTNNNKEISMPTKYNPKEVEKGRYEFWLEGKYFEADGDENKEPYTIVIPPPNVTGSLHLGHAWDTTMQDTLARMKRMQGYDVLRSEEHTSELQSR